MDVVVLAIALLVLAVAVAWHVVEHYRGQHIAAKRRVVVNLVNDQAFTGVLWRRYRRMVVLRGASLVEPGRDPVPMDGEVVIDRDQISFTQIMGG